MLLFFFVTQIESEILKKKEYKNTILPDINLLNITNYTKIQIFLERTSLIVNDNDIGEKLRQFINEKTNIMVDLNNNNSPNQIILDFNKETKSYKFSYFIKDKNNNNEIYPFKDYMLSNNKAKNIFDSINPENLTKFYKNNADQIENFYLYQSLLAKFIINQTGQVPNKNINFKFGFNSFPISTYLSNDSILKGISIYISIGFYYVSIFISMHMLEEKEQKIDLLLNGIGISHKTDFLNWILLYIMQNSIIFIITYVGFCFILYLNHFLILLYLSLYTITTFCLVYLLASISKTKKNGLILINIVFVLPFLIAYFMQGREMALIIKIVLSLFPIINLSNSFDIFVKFITLQNTPLSFITMNINGISLLITTIILIIEILIFIFIIYSIKKCRQYGFSFIELVKFIFTKKNPKNLLIQKGNKENLLNNNDDNNNLSSNHEELSEINQSLKNQNNFLKIQNISKNFNDVKAVSDFNGELFKNEIFVLLGHNGAGKTTLIKLIAGAEAPDSGDILLNNESLIQNKDYLYQNLGVCYQEDIFFNYLKVEEQIRLMMEIKGKEYNKEQIDNLINEIGLTDKKNAICKNLSGGQKRKLCVALSLIGNSQIVLLDEPSSGLDVISRRKFWDFLKLYKNDKIIIITTHSLEEAEYLGDRIGIMNSGIFVCSGSSSYLKEKYITGFNLNLIVNDKIFNENKKNELYNNLKNLEENLEIKISSKHLFSILLKSNNKNIKEVFELIEQNKENYGIEDYTVNSTSLEDVFLKVNNNTILNDLKNNNDININNINRNSINNEIIEINDLQIVKPIPCISQLVLHFKRLFLSLWRKKGSNFLEFLYCILLVYVYLIIPLIFLVHSIY